MLDVAASTVAKNKISHARVLVLDDDLSSCLILADFLGQFCHVDHLTEMTDIHEELDRYKPDLILLDIFLGPHSGIEICKAIKQSALYADIPVIFITAAIEQEELEECWQAGCVDFISKPFSFTTLTNRVKVHLLLRFQAQMLQEKSYKDGLTGLYNRTYLSHAFPLHYAQCQREGAPLTILLLDIDWFKRYNDQYGHVQGDDCIVAVAEAIVSQTRRPLDMVFRYGGEEFLCLLPNTDSKGAENIAKQILNTVRELDIPHQQSDFATVTLSIGAYTSHSKETQALTELVELADQALYRAKAQGRNQYCRTEITAETLLTKE